MTRYLPGDHTHWTGRSSQSPLYLHQTVRPIDLDTPAPQLATNLAGSYCILGYACDEGVRRNQGRVGAAQGPMAFRRALGRLPFHPESSSASGILDAGDLVCPDEQLQATQTQLGQRVAQLLAHGAKPLLVGGGHDIAWGHYLGLRAHLGDSARIGIVNFDAHFDLRTPDPQPSSGTPFYQVAKHTQGLGQPFDYLCLGVRKDSNDRSLFAAATSLGAQWLMLSDLQEQTRAQMASRLDDFCRNLDALYLTVCLDVFSSAYAPGVSAASPFGLCANLGLTLIESVLAQPKLISCDIAELCPVHDRDDQCAKLAAGIAHRMLHHIP